MMLSSSLQIYLLQVIIFLLSLSSANFLYSLREVGVILSTWPATFIRCAAFDSYSTCSAFQLTYSYFYVGLQVVRNYQTLSGSSSFLLLGPIACIAWVFFYILLGLVIIQWMFHPFHNNQPGIPILR